MVMTETLAPSRKGTRCACSLTTTALHSLARGLERHRRSARLPRFPAAATVVV
jgi:hypothetical protein